MQNEFCTDFGLFRLHATLVELGCDGATQSRLIAWYWQHAKEWVADDQTEFDCTARNNLQTAVAAITRNTLIFGSHAETSTPAIRGGMKKSIPANLRSRQIVETDTGKRHIAETQIQDDAMQNAWVRLLETGATDAKSAYIAGMSAGRDATRDNQRYLPASQMGLPEDEAQTQIPPWERSIDFTSKDFDHYVWKSLNQATDDNRRKVLLAYWDESPEDIEFLFSYLARQTCRKRPASQKDRDRVSSILKKLRRLEQKTGF